MSFKTFPTQFPHLSASRSSFILSDDGSQNGYLTPADILAQAQAQDFVGVLLPLVAANSAVTLNTASHNTKTIFAQNGTSLSIDWTAVANGFSVTVINMTGSDLPITMTNFTNSVPNEPDGNTKIRSNGVASLWAISPDAGTTKYLFLVGSTAP